MFRHILATAIAVLTVATAALAQTSGLPVPRFVSLRAEEANLRAGPGDRYPVEWIYSRRDMPVEVVAEFGHWRKIRDWEGTEGWVHQSLLSGRRTVLVLGRVRTLRKEPGDGAGAVAMVEAGVVGRLLKCPQRSDFCRIEAGGRDGWLKRDEFWGVYPGEWLD